MLRASSSRAAKQPSQEGMMEACKLASVAGMVTMAASVFVEWTVPTLVQVGQPTAQPGAAPGHEGMWTDKDPVFQLREGVERAKLERLGAELAELERDMGATNERLMNKLIEARLLETDKKLDAMSEVLSGVLEQHAHMRDHLSKLRETVTGKVSNRLLSTPEPEEKIEEPKKDLEDGEDEDDVKPPTDHPAPTPSPGR
jgi:hypothetical protein